jgi:N-acetyl-anhydromuramyl-L-alanine amidase AmpD
VTAWHDMPIIHAANYTVANRKSVDLIVLHSMESPEKPGTARNVAKWFAGETAPQASCHYCVDPSETICCVLDEEIAWHAPGVNSRAIGIEHAGRAAQSKAEWDDDDSMATLLRSIDLCEALCLKWDIPAVLALATQLPTDGVWRGITTHALVSKAFPGKGDHWDPGPNFPLDWYIGRVKSRIAFDH